MYCDPHLNSKRPPSPVRHGGRDTRCSPISKGARPHTGDTTLPRQLLPAESARPPATRTMQRTPGQYTGYADTVLDPSTLYSALRARSGCRSLATVCLVPRARTPCVTTILHPRPAQADPPRALSGGACPHKAHFEDDSSVELARRLSDAGLPIPPVVKPHCFGSQMLLADA